MVAPSWLVEGWRCWWVALLFLCDCASGGGGSGLSGFRAAPLSLP